MIASVASLLLPLAFTAGFGSIPPALYHHNVRAFVTGYNTVPGQTDATPCIAASGADICGRRDAVACPRRISLGTVVEIRGTAYVCEDRLAKKFDARFDISCDKDLACPYQVAGWTTVTVYDDPRSENPAPTAKVAIYRGSHEAPTRSAQHQAHRSAHRAPRHSVTRVAAGAARKLVASAGRATRLLRGHA